MNIRKFAVASLFAAGAAIAPQLSSAAVEVHVGVAPPEARYEAVPPPRHGYVWAPGYWAWNGHKHVWKSGHWVKERHGHHYVAENWEHRGDRWYFHNGHWDRD